MHPLEKRVLKHLLTATSLRALWELLINTYFPERIDLIDFEIVWSTRPQKRTLASCNLKSRRVIVAREMNNVKFFEYLEPLLYHELCHAVLGNLREHNKRAKWHGKAFRELEKRHPGIRHLDTWVKEGGFGKAVRTDRALHRVRDKLDKRKQITLPYRLGLKLI